MWLDVKLATEALVLNFVFSVSVLVVESMKAKLCLCVDAPILMKLRDRNAHNHIKI